MGTTYYFIMICHCIPPADPLKTTDWVTICLSIIGALINSALAVWIVRTIQNRVANKRVLKDHFISEVKDLRNEYRVCLDELHSNSMNPKAILPWLKLMNLKVDDLLDLMHKKYKIDKKTLFPYQHNLRELITGNVDFERDYQNSITINFSDASKNALIKFQQENNHLFNELIIEINDAE